MADFATRRTIMVDTQVRPSDVTKYPIIEAMLTVPRENYVPDASRAVAYAEDDIALPGGGVVLAPRTFSKLLDAAEIDLNDVILDLGCGLGYSTAVLAHMSQAVVAVEPNAELAEEAQRILSSEGVDNAAVICSDLVGGAPNSGPYDVIIAEGAVELWPDSLTAQLREEGRALAMWCEGALCKGRVGLKQNGRLVWRDLFTASAPVLAGFERAKEFSL